MKKILTLFLALTVLAGCSKDESPTPAPAEPVGGAISLRSEGALENEPAAKAATRRETAAEQALTYTFEAWTRGANPRCVLHKTAAGTLTEAAIEIALVPGSYDFLFPIIRINGLPIIRHPIFRTGGHLKRHTFSVRRFRTKKSNMHDCIPYSETYRANRFPENCISGMSSLLSETKFLLLGRRPSQIRRNTPTRP